jgi:[histone H3]-dimethyl-L-lysine9 demethylase
MSRKNLDYAAFKRSWARGEPIIVTDVQHTIQGTWDPTYFTEVFGPESVTVVDCKTDQEVNSTVAEFFQTFGDSGLQSRALKIKVRVAC